MTVQYIQIEKKKPAIVDVKGAENLLEYLEDLEDSLEALRRVSKKSKLISHESVKNEFLQNHICQTRLKLGFTQVDLAKRLKTTQAYVSKIENLDYRPSLSVLEKVALALKVDLQDLI